MNGTMEGRARRGRRPVAVLAIVAAAGMLQGWMAGPAEAAPISGVGATLTIEITGLEAIVIPGSGTVDVAPDGSISLAAGFVSATNLLVPVTSTTAVYSLTASFLGNQAGTFSPLGASAVPDGVCGPGEPLSGQACVGGGGLGGALGLSGILNVVIVPSFVVFPLDLDGLQVGQGGAGNMPFTYDAAPWTTGTARVNLGGSPPYGGVLTTTGSHAGTSLTLVTTTFVAACGNLLPVFASLEITGIPEPGMAGLLAAGAAGLALAVGRRRRS